MYEHRVIEIPKEAQRRSEDGRRNLTTFLEEKFNEYSNLWVCILCLPKSRQAAVSGLSSPEGRRQPRK